MGVNLSVKSTVGAYSISVNVLAHKTSCFCRKSVFNKEIYMVHLNLAIALLCGLIVFVSGVETATDNEVSYAKVIIVLLNNINGTGDSTGWLYTGHLTFALLFSGCFCLGIM